MMLTDKDIRKLSRVGEKFLVPRLETDEVIFSEYTVEKPLVNPFVEPFQGNGIVSFGLTSAGYDLRLDNEEVLFFKNSFGHRIDPKKFSDEKYRKEVFDIRCFEPHEQVIVPAGGYILARSYEYIYIPWFLKGRVVGKSTYARTGVIVNTTPLEPEWESHLTIEIANPSSCDVVLYALEGIAQLEFEMLTGRPQVTYKDKQGKYLNQKGVTVAVVK